MAEGGFDDENPNLDWHLDHDDEDDDDDEQGVNRTWPFQPGSAVRMCAYSADATFVALWKFGQNGKRWSVWPNEITEKKQW